MTTQTLRSVDVSASLISVNLVHELVDDPHGDVGRSAIDKRPVSGAVMLSHDGPVGDVVMDRDNHGGHDQAVYAYAIEDLDAWSQITGREFVPGQFGENLTTKGLDVTGAVIGEVWAIGDARLQVRDPRTPCTTFQNWLGEAHWVKRFTEKGDPGAYLKVLTPGEVQAGDTLTREQVPAHGVTIGDVFQGRRGDRSKLQRLLQETDLAEALVPYLHRELAVGNTQEN
ncbi:MAG TPA: MOSC domain-containing protein [Actinomycetes bacterium]|nr:MOSC domain-containing protein [Actinomycetes bacterium]